MKCDKQLHGGDAQGIFETIADLPKVYFTNQTVWGTEVNITQDKLF